VEVAKALGGSFKLVTPAPKPVREMTQLLRKHKRMGHTNQSCGLRLLVLGQDRSETKKSVLVLHTVVLVKMANTVMQQ